MLRIFIGWDSRFPEAADVLRYSLLKQATIPLEIHYLKLVDLDLLRPRDPLASTECAYARFLVPYLCNYRGKAMFLSSDTLCLADVREIDQLDMVSYALRIVEHRYSPSQVMNVHGCLQNAYPRKNWSSPMLMDCSKLRLWTREAVESYPAAYFERFQDIPGEQIGEIPWRWSALDALDQTAKLVHFASGTPRSGRLSSSPHATLWARFRDDMLAAADAARHCRTDSAASLGDALLATCDSPALAAH